MPKRLWLSTRQGMACFHEQYMVPVYIGMVTVYSWKFAGIALSSPLLIMLQGLGDLLGQSGWAETAPVMLSVRLLFVVIEAVWLVAMTQLGTAHDKTNQLRSRALFFAASFLVMIQVADAVSGTMGDNWASVVPFWLETLMLLFLIVVKPRFKRQRKSVRR